MPEGFSYEQGLALHDCACALSVLVTAIAKKQQVDYDSPTVHYARERLWRLADSLSSLPAEQRNFFLQFERAVA